MEKILELYSCSRIFTFNVALCISQVLGSHNKSVNSVAFDCEGGELLASVGDDCRCVVWNTQQRQKHCEFPLKSAGVDVKFHQQDNTKV